MVSETIIDKNSDGLILLNDALKEMNFSRTHMNLLIDRGNVNVAKIDGNTYITHRELQRFKAMKSDQKRELLRKISEQNDMRDKAIAEIAELF